MHSHTLRTKFTFGDRVRFDSRLQGCVGEGKIFAVMLDRFGQISYLIDTTPTDEYVDTLVQGIMENEIVLLQE